MWMAFEATRLAEVTKRMSVERQDEGTACSRCISCTQIGLDHKAPLQGHERQTGAPSWSLVVRGLNCHLKEFDLEETILAGLGGF